jgi:succinate dehydrogenase/fumarate reductase flavoprotein subunit
MDIQRTATDVLVIGGGGAGARAALSAAENGVAVTIVCKELIARSGSTPMASWGFAASFGHADPADSPRQHFLDTLREGRFLSDQDLAETLALKAPEAAQELENYGLRIRKKEDGRYEQIIVPGETYPRSLIIEGGGRRIIQVLREQLRKYPQVTVLEDTLIIGLLQQEKEVTGAWGFNFREGALVLLEAGAVILATGGNGGLWGFSDNPSGNIGDGHYLAYQAGASLVDLEQMLFYPMVVIDPPDAQGTLLDYEVCIDPAFCDGKLFNGQGEEFLSTKALPARDELLKAISREIRQGRGSPHGGVYLDLRCSSKSREEKEKIAKTMLSAYPYFKELGIDLLARPVEIAPAAHYALGGIQIDSTCRTGVPGLFAAGEVTGNIHGANRISGNALAETQVFGKIAGESAAEYARRKKAEGQGKERQGRKARQEQVKAVQERLAEWFDFTDVNRGGRLSCQTEVFPPIKTSFQAKRSPHALKQRIREIMDQALGYGRSEEGLQRARQELQQLEAVVPQLPVPSGGVFNLALLDALEGKMMLEVARLVCTAALARKETRGHHYREDYPQMDEGTARHTVLAAMEGEMVVKLQSARQASGLWESAAKEERSP